MHEYARGKYQLTVSPFASTDCLYSARETHKSRSQRFCDIMVSFRKPFDFINGIFSRYNIKLRLFINCQNILNLNRLKRRCYCKNLASRISCISIRFRFYFDVFLLLLFWDVYIPNRSFYDSKFVLLLYCSSV